MSGFPTNEGMDSGLAGCLAVEIHTRASGNGWQPPPLPRRMLLTPGKWTLGSAADNRIVLEEGGIAPRHGLIVVSQHHSFVTVWNHESRLNGNPFTDAELHAGDRLAIGRHELRFLTPAPSYSAAKSTGAWHAPVSARSESAPAASDGGAAAPLSDSQRHAWRPEVTGQSLLDQIDRLKELVDAENPQLCGDATSPEEDPGAERLDRLIAAIEADLQRRRDRQLDETLARVSPPAECVSEEQVAATWEPGYQTAAVSENCSHDVWTSGSAVSTTMATQSAATVAAPSARETAVAMDQEFDRLERMIAALGAQQSALQQQQDALERLAREQQAERLELAALRERLAHDEELLSLKSQAIDAEAEDLAQMYRTLAEESSALDGLRAEFQSRISDRFSDIETVGGVSTGSPLEAGSIEEAVVEEAVVDEAVADEAVADEPVVDEAVVDEAVVNEAVVNEAVVDEAVADEAVADEAVDDECAVDEEDDIPAAQPVSLLDGVWGVWDSSNSHEWPEPDTIESADGRDGGVETVSESPLETIGPDQPLDASEAYESGQSEGSHDAVSDGADWTEDSSFVESLAEPGSADSRFEATDGPAAEDFESPELPVSNGGVSGGGESPGLAVPVAVEDSVELRRLQKLQDQLARESAGWQRRHSFHAAVEDVLPPRGEHSGVAAETTSAEFAADESEEAADIAIETCHAPYDATNDLNALIGTAAGHTFGGVADDAGASGCRIDDVLGDVDESLSSDRSASDLDLQAAGVAAAQFDASLTVSNALRSRDEAVRLLDELILQASECADDVEVPIDRQTRHIPQGTVSHTHSNPGFGTGTVAETQPAAADGGWDEVPGDADCVALDCVAVECVESDDVAVENVDSVYVHADHVDELRDGDTDFLNDAEFDSRDGSQQESTGDRLLDLLESTADALHADFTDESPDWAADDVEPSSSAADFEVDGTLEGAANEYAADDDSFESAAEQFFHNARSIACQDGAAFDPYEELRLSLDEAIDTANFAETEFVEDAAGLDFAAEQSDELVSDSDRDAADSYYEEPASEDAGEFVTPMEYGLPEHGSLLASDHPAGVSDDDGGVLDFEDKPEDDTFRVPTADVAPVAEVPPVNLRSQLAMMFNIPSLDDIERRVTIASGPADATNDGVTEHSIAEPVSRRRTTDDDDGSGVGPEVPSDQDVDADSDETLATDQVPDLNSLALGGGNAPFGESPRKSLDERFNSFFTGGHAIEEARRSEIAAERSPLDDIGLEEEPEPEQVDEPEPDIEPQDDISAYMQQLLARNRQQMRRESDHSHGTKPTPQPSGKNAAPAKPGAATVPDRTAKAAAPPVDASASIAPPDRSYLTQAPQHRQNKDQVRAEVQALREVANSSARSAVATATRREMRLQVITRTLGAVVFSGIGVTAFILQVSPVFAWGLIGIGAVFAVELTVHLIGCWRQATNWKRNPATKKPECD